MFYKFKSNTMKNYSFYSIDKALLFYHVFSNSKAATPLNNSNYFEIFK